MAWDALSNPGKRWKKCGHLLSRFYRLKRGVKICLDCKQARARDYYYRKKAEREGI